MLNKILGIILILGFAVRLYGFTNPIADWHSWRQADTSAVSRNFVTSGYDILHPRFDDLSNVPSERDNPQGYRFVEFPVYNILQAGLFQLFGVLTLEEWGRLISIITSLVGSFFLYKLVNRYSGGIAGLAVAFFYTFLPYNIYYSRTILPDPSMVSMTLGGLYFFDLWAREKKKSWRALIISALFTLISLLLKPYAAFYALPFAAIAYSTFGWGMLKQVKLWFFAILSVTPLILWRVWMQQYPEGIPANAWLLNGNGIRFRPAFFRWMGYERLTKLISGYMGVILLAFGLYQLKFEKAKLFYGSFLLTSLLYVVIFATGNVQHDYYQIVIMPAVAVLLGLGTKFLLGERKIKLISFRTFLFVVITFLSLYMSWMQVRDYFNINNWAIVTAGKAVDELTPKDAKVIANYNGDTSFLYQTKRKGWASFQKSLPEMVELGADYLVLVNPTQADHGIGNEYKIIKETKDYLLFDLHQKP